MKWKAKPIPRHDDHRWTLRFAFVPHRCVDGYVRWLCDLYVHQRFVQGRVSDFWVNIEYSATLP